MREIRAGGGNPCGSNPSLIHSSFRRRTNDLYSVVDMVKMGSIEGNVLFGDYWALKQSLSNLGVGCSIVVGHLFLIIYFFLILSLK